MYNTIKDNLEFLLHKINEVSSSTICMNKPQQKKYYHKKDNRSRNYDEVQNLTPHEVKTLISRAGEGAKVILVEDPYQIDSPYLDFVSNGLVVASEKFKRQKLFGSVYLHISERSELSALANELM